MKIIILKIICVTFFNQNCLYKFIGIYLKNTAFFPYLEIDVIDKFMNEFNTWHIIKNIQNPSTFKFKFLKKFIIS